MTTPTTPEQARALDGYFLSMDERGAVINSLADQAEALTADLAAEKLFSKQAMDSVTEIAAQRDALTKERDEWKSKHFAFKDRDDMRNDAERYRFLRSAKTIAISHEASICPVAYDAAIDAAMKAES